MRKRFTLNREHYEFATLLLSPHIFGLLKEDVAIQGMPWSIIHHSEEMQDKCGDNGSYNTGGRKYENPSLHTSSFYHITLLSNQYKNCNVLIKLLLSNQYGYSKHVLNS